MHELASDAGERCVALAVVNWLGENRVPVFKRLSDLCARPWRLLLWVQHNPAPGEILRGVDRPRICWAARVNRWWRDHVAAVTANIEPGAKLAGAVADFVL